MGSKETGENGSANLIQKSCAEIDIDSVVHAEEDALSMYKKNALDVVNFKIVHSEEDLEKSLSKQNSFKPDMAHQIFGENESIFGYRSVNITLYYMHNSARCYIDVKASGEIEKTDDHQSDDILEALNPWLPKSYSTKRDDFIEKLNKEVHDTLYGTVLETFKTENKLGRSEQEQACNYKITLCDKDEEGFKEFHERFETFIIWFIDGANFIDLDDVRWMIFYVYEEMLDETTQKLVRSPIGFCTVYKFFAYPDHVRARISQFFILPTHQRRGIGTKFYTSVFNYLKAMPEVIDITVEEPTRIFQRIRDFCDSLLIYNTLKEKSSNITIMNIKQRARIMQSHKIGKRQSQRIYDILEYLKARNSSHKDSSKFVENIKARIINEMEKDASGSKKRSSVKHNAVAVDPMDIKLNAHTECKRYIHSLEWPLNALNKLSVNF